MTADVLGDRALNRATLERQLLLRRASLPTLDAVRHLVGLQAQKPLDPYLALWSRLDGFDPVELGRLLEARAVVRIVVMRGTIHLVTGDDALALRPLMQPVLDAEISRHRDHAPHLVDVDIGPVLAQAHAILAAEPLTTSRLREALADRFPDLDAAALAYACRCHLALVQVPPRGVWGMTRQVTLAPLDTWLGRELAGASPASPEGSVLRYLAAFGPATTADVTTWCRLTGLREVLERLRPQLRTFRDEQGRELFDLDDAPRPAPDTPAPVRFCPEYDNILLSHADRSRFAAAGSQSLAGATSPFCAVLVDGRVRGTWRSEQSRSRSAVLTVEHLPLTGSEQAEVEAEAGRLSRFWHPGAADHDVRLVPFG